MRQRFIMFAACPARERQDLKKSPTPLGPPYEPRHGPTVGSYGVAVYHKRGAPVKAQVAGHDGERQRFIMFAAWPATACQDLNPKVWG